MTNKIDEVEYLKTEIIGIKIRLERIEDLLLELPIAADYIHESATNDFLYENAKKAVSGYDFASASLIQRRLKIGYTRAARILDELEQAGLVGPGEGAKPRKVLISNKSK